MGGLAAPDSILPRYNARTPSCGDFTGITGKQPQELELVLSLAREGVRLGVVAYYTTYEDNVERKLPTPLNMCCGSGVDRVKPEILKTPRVDYNSGPQISVVEDYLCPLTTYEEVITWLVFAERLDKSFDICKLERGTPVKRRVDNHSLKYEI
jgi:hypothetical protein